MTSFTEWIPMRQRELQRYHTLRVLVEHRITGPEAVQSLGLSPRRVRWVLVRVRWEGRRASDPLLRGARRAHATSVECHPLFHDHLHPSIYS